MAHWELQGKGTDISMGKGEKKADITNSQRREEEEEEKKEEERGGEKSAAASARDATFAFLKARFEKI